MRRTLKFIFISALLMGCDNPIKADKHQPFMIGEIGLGTPSQTVIEKLGSPLTIKNVTRLCNSTTLEGICEYWRYEDSWFYIDNGEVWGLSSKTTNLCLSDEVCPNDSIQTVFNHLGETQIFPAEGDKPPSLNYFSETHEFCWLWVFLNNTQDKIVELRLACQP